MGVAAEGPIASPVGRSWPAITYEVGREKIREYAAAVGESAPIHHDPEAARAAGFPAVVAPPLFAAVFCAPAVGAIIFDPAVGIFDPAKGIAGFRFVHRRQSFEFIRPVCSGDVLTTTPSLVEAGERNGRALRVFESLTRNQRGEDVVRAIYEGVIPSTEPRPARRSPEAGALVDGEPWPAPRDVGGLAAGDVLPTLLQLPDRYTGCRYAGASGDFTPFHYDDEFARSLGMPGMILHGLYTMAVLGRAHTAPFGGDPRVLRSITARFRAPAVPERELRARAVVTAAGADGVELRSEVRQGETLVLEGEHALLRPV